MKLERIRHPYSRALGTFRAYGEKAQETRTYNEALELSALFQREALDILAELSYAATGGTGGKAREDRVYRAVCRLVSRGTKAPPEELLFPDELLFEVSKIVADILASGAEKLDFTIFNDPLLSEAGVPVQNTDKDTESDFPIGFETAPKRAILFGILGSHGIDTKDIGYSQETLGNTKWRKVPYSIIHLPHPGCTVLVSDEIGEMTYIYSGLHDVEAFRNLKK